MIDPERLRRTNVHPLYDPKHRPLSNWQTLVEFVRWYWPRFWARRT